MSNDQGAPTGPDRETLKNLAGMLPSFVQGMEKKRALGKGKAVQIPRPTKVCKVCGLLFDKVMAAPSKEMDIHPTYCDRCDKELKSGCTAIVCGDLFAFVTSSKLMDKAGEVMHVSPNVMEAISKQYAVKKRESESGNPSDN